MASGAVLDTRGKGASSGHRETSRRVGSGSEVQGGCKGCVLYQHVVSRGVIGPTREMKMGSPDAL